MSVSDGLREALGEALPPHQTWCQAIGHFDCCGKTEADCDCGIVESLEALLPIVWSFAAQELRRAAEDGARQRVGLPQTWNWLRDRAGVMDGGERR